MIDENDDANEPDDTAVAEDTGKSRTDDGGPDELSTRLAAAEAEAAKWKAQARKHEGRARDNAQAASKSQTLEQQIEQLRKDLSERDGRDVERNGRLAMTQLRGQIAEAGIKPKDVTDLLELVDPGRLLHDGEPDEQAISKIAASIARTGGRPTPDRDQGRRGGTAPEDMNQAIRRLAGYAAP